MERHRLQLSVGMMLGLVACVALNLWLFRFGALMGILGLNVTKHVVIASLCQMLGVDRRVAREPVPAAPAPSPTPGVPVP